MGQDASAGGAAMTDSPDPEQLQREIERTREELGDTVAALTAKADVKAQAKQKLDEARTSAAVKGEQLREKAKEISPDSASTAAAQVSQKAKENPAPLAAAALFAAGFLVGRRSRRKR